MASGGRIKGITVEIGGDVGPLSAALKGVNGTIRETGSQLKDVNRLLKLDPTNVTLLGQKADISKKQLLALQQKEADLKAADAGMKKQLSEGKISTEQYQGFQRELTATQEKIEKLKKQTHPFATELELAGDSAKQSGQKIASAGEKMLPATAAIGAVGGAAVKTASDFETSMSQTAGALDIPMSKMGGLRDLAMDMGAKTQFSATEAGNAMTELAKGGLTEADIKGGALKATMDLAASSGLELGDAANTVVQAMGGFGLTAKDSAQAVNALAGAAAASSTDVGPLADALSQCAAQAHTAGWSIQDTTAVLGAFADAGITGSDAGTSLKTMLQRLGAPTDAAAKEMKSLGINVWDSNGHMKDASGVADELKTHLGGLSDQQKQQALTTIFGSDATRAATVLMGEGSAGLTKYTKATNDQTAASRLANSQMGPTEKALEEMKGSLETAAISIGTMLLPMIQKLTGFIKGLADSFSALNPQQQQIILTILGITAAIGPLLILIGKLKEGVGGLMDGIAFLIKHPIVAGILIAIAAIAALVIAVKHLWDTNEGFRNGLISGWTAIVGFFNGIPGWWNALWAGIGAFFTTIWNGIIGFFTTTIPAAWGTVTSFFNAIPGWWNGLWTQVGQFFANCWNGIISFFTTTIPTWIAAVGQWFQQIPYNLGLALGTAIRAVIDFGKNVWNWVTTDLPKIIQGIIGWFAQLPGRIWTFLVQVVTNIGKWGANMWNSATQWASKTINSIGQWFSQLPGRIWNWLLQAIARIGNWGNQTYTSATSAASRTITGIGNWFQQLPGRIWGFLTTVISNIGSWGRNMINTAGRAAKNTFDSIVNAFKNLPGEMLNIGKNVVHGIWDGITGAAGWLWDKISGFCKDFVKGFKKGLKIGSPSKVFADAIGKNVALGIGEGFSNQMKSVAASMTDAMRELAVGINTPDWNIQQPAYAAAPAVGPTINYTANYNSPAAPTPADVNRVNRQNAQRLALISRRNRR